MSKPKLKARILWAGASTLKRGVRMNLVASESPVVLDDTRVAVIPLDDVDALVEKAGIAIAKKRGYGPQYAPKFWLAARAALAAIGVRKQRKGRK